MSASENKLKIVPTKGPMLLFVSCLVRGHLLVCVVNSGSSRHAPTAHPQRREKVGEKVGI